MIPRLISDISKLKGHLGSGEEAEAWVFALEQLAKLVMEAFGDVQSEIHREGGAPEAVFQRADKALYQARREGKTALPYPLILSPVDGRPGRGPW